MKIIEFDEVKDIFINDMIGFENAFKRVSPHHPLELMLGVNENSNYTLLLITENKPEFIPDSSMINICVGKRSDGKYSISFSLLNDKYFDLFCYFCLDMIISSVECSKENDAEFLCNRYLLWEKMLKKTKNMLLTDNETKGLIGELFFLKEYLIKKYGIEKSINYWTGPQKTDQDFNCEETWYEIKTTSSGSTSIKISSVEQLDTDRDGNLVVLFLDKTSTKDSKRLNLNKLVKEIKNLINDEKTESLFDGILLSSGYIYNSEYDNRNYRFAKGNIYCVTKDFPCLRQNVLSEAVGKVGYELILNKIVEWGMADGITRI